MANWSLDKAHSEIEFKVRHMMISSVNGQFQEFDINMENDSEDLTKSKINVSIDAASITTKNEQRDQHLTSEDFFDTAKFPKIKFESTEIKKNGESDFLLTGNLTLKDVSKPITLKVEFGGIAKDPWGNQKAGYTISGKINREEFGLTWNTALETGGVMVSNEVNFHSEVQFTLS